jgi:hypothetical protein
VARRASDGDNPAVSSEAHTTSPCAAPMMPMMDSGLPMMQH